MPRASLYSRVGEDRHSLYSYSSDTYAPSTTNYYSRSMSRARSVSREPSVSSVRSSSLTLRTRLNDDLNVIFIYLISIKIFKELKIFVTSRKRQIN
jgi:hypothetical protein